ncbi:DoxX family protein [Sinomonas sp. JGH33]|uniref:DoxX family protein n=1 Tax=Sinomonas terricola TaxID=3110330 RepID=A0ABU5T9B9_9MICC|nr:DoxX family protein [Sinomonas sp. JGH33]MEA5456286.1 DoxX family protein [Sinomonas sp. JGH33]
MSSSIRPFQIDLARFLLRVIVGIVFFAHGWQKFFAFTIPGTQGAFAKMHVPAAELAAPAMASLELVGGALLVVGLLARIAAGLLALEMLGAVVLVHARSGLFVDQGGMELALLLAAAAAAIALMGAGRFSLDHAVFGRRGGRLAVLA